MSRFYGLPSGGDRDPRIPPEVWRDLTENQREPLQEGEFRGQNSYRPPGVYLPETPIIAPDISEIRPPTDE
jgi:hypothetical protein